MLFGTLTARVLRAEASVEFEDIQVVDFLPDRTQKSNTASGLRHLFLKLSDSPPRDWATLFEQERSFPRHTMWRRAWIQGDCVVIDCVPEELEKYHLRDVKEDVVSANAKYRQHMAEQQRRLEAEEKRRAEEAQRLRDLKGRLNF